MVFEFEIFLVGALLVGIATGALLTRAWAWFSKPLQLKTETKTNFTAPADHLPQIVYITRAGTCYHLDSRCQKDSKRFTLCEHCKKKLQ